MPDTVAPAGIFANPGKDQIAEELDRVRSVSLGMLDPLPESAQLSQHSPLMSPLIWDLAHVGNYEEIWLLRAVTGTDGVAPEIDDMYDAFRHSRSERIRLSLLGVSESRSYISEVRSKVIDTLEEVDLDTADPLLSSGFVYGMAIQHEHQHDETMLATIQLMGRENPELSRAAVEALHAPESRTRPASASRPPATGERFVPGGEFPMGTDLDPWAYDNERPLHSVDVDPFYIDATPVSNRDFAAFIEDGGYDDLELWSPAGRKWLVESGARAPEFWSREGSTWKRRRFGRDEAVPPDEAVQHVCYYEAEAYAKWIGKRLPTETEWEKAASWTPEGRKLRYPWGDSPPTPELANLGKRRLGPAPVGDYPLGSSPCGARQMIGDVWEWTSSDFRAYPGFSSFPYREYSEVFFGADYKVLRGGSWATDPAAIRNTFRNWDFPIRRQIFAGFRCARDA